VGGVEPTCLPTGVNLAAPVDPILDRTKSAAVWWMLRGIVGDDALKQSLQAYRANPKLDRDPTGFEHTLEQLSKMDLRWFFDNWVYQDRGLPDLTIVSVTPSQLETHDRLPSGWLVAVEVRNEGYAEAEVPVTVRSADAAETHLLRIPGRASASTRILFSGTPQRVQVNDGSVPETQTSLHTRQLVLPTH
jgi:aminopeptidase N